MRQRNRRQVLHARSRACNCRYRLERRSTRGTASAPGSRRAALASLTRSRSLSRSDARNSGSLPGRGSAPRRGLRGAAGAPAVPGGLLGLSRQRRLRCRPTALSLQRLQHCAPTPAGARSRLAPALPRLERALGGLASALRSLASGGRFEWNARAPRFREPDRDRLLGRFRAVLALADVVHLLSHELASRRRGPLALAEVFHRALHRLSLRHRYVLILRAVGACDQRLLPALSSLG